jgi:predicted Zn-dependent protease
MTRNCILNFLGLHHLLAGELATAERLIDEGRLIADATGNLPVTYAAMLLTAWQGRVHEASELIQAAVQMATGSGRGMLAGFSAYANAMLAPTPPSATRTAAPIHWPLALSLW